MDQKKGKSVDQVDKVVPKLQRQNAVVGPNPLFTKPPPQVLEQLQMSPEKPEFKTPKVPVEKKPHPGDKDNKERVEATKKVCEVCKNQLIEGQIYPLGPDHDYPCCACYRCGQIPPRKNFAEVPEQERVPCAAAVEDYLRAVQEMQPADSKRDPGDAA